MKIVSFKNENVLPDGTFKDELGSVNTEGGVSMSMKVGGCNISGCKCSEGHWLLISKPRTEEGIVEGLRVEFDNRKEMEDSLSQE